MAHMNAFRHFASNFQTAKWYSHECTIWDRFGKSSETKTSRNKFSDVFKSVLKCAVNFGSADLNEFGMIIKIYGQDTMCPSSILSDKETDTYRPKYIAKVSLCCIEKCNLE